MCEKSVEILLTVNEIKAIIISLQVMEAEFGLNSHAEITLKKLQVMLERLEQRFD